MYLDAILFSNIFKTFTKSLVVRDCDGTSVGDVAIVCFLFFGLFLNVLL